METKEPLLEFELLSEEVKDILTTPPNWLTRWGISIILSIVILIIISCWIVSYSDTISASVIITTETPPVSISSPSGGRISEFYVSNDQIVTQNTPILLLENTSNLKDIQNLKKQLISFKESNGLFENKNLVSYFENNSYTLGELQPSYASLKNQFDSYRFYLKSNTVLIKVELLEQKKKQIQVLIENLNKLLVLKEKEKQNSKNKLESHKKLYEQKVISLLDYNQIESEFFSREFEIDNIKSSIIRNNIEISEIGNQIADASFSLNNQKNLSNEKLIEQANNLWAQILEWERKYLIKSPISGRVSLLNVWKANQMTAAGQEILKIVPNWDKLLVKGTVSSEGVGKIKLGQKAIIKVEAYPFEEYGVLEAHISSISLAPQDGKYFVELSLPNELKTSYNKVLVLKQEMKANAEIITHKRSLLERLFDKVLGKLQV